ncbi:hypothetical protein AB6A40_007763 [Gnathostoma spinigerum]|uniref:Uncharacterized protein n=1 Tax=Gnathostoma spinigerum TaxID=75299 RepID=A0ABD6ESB2_9BILA
MSHVNSGKPTVNARAVRISLWRRIVVRAVIYVVSTKESAVQCLRKEVQRNQTEKHRRDESPRRVPKESASEITDDIVPRSHIHFGVLHFNSGVCLQTKQFLSESSARWNTMFYCNKYLSILISHAFSLREKN